MVSSSTTIWTDTTQFHSYCQLQIENCKHSPITCIVMASPLNNYFCQEVCIILLLFFHKFVFRFDQLYCDAFSVSDSVSLDQTWDRTPSKAPVLSFIHITQYWLVPGTDLSAFSTGRKGLSFSNSSYLSNDISSVSLVVWHLLLLDTIWHLVSQVQNMRAAIASWQTFYQNDV